jgi:AcrR family transcriptional regulator
MSHRSFLPSPEPKPLAKARRAPLTAKAAATRQRILVAAEQEFAEHGYHGTGVAGIALRAGLAQGTLYIYFQSKDEIFKTLVGDIGARLRQRTGASLQSGGTRLEGERKALESFFEFVQEHPGTYRIIQELQFVDAALHREYYRSFVRSYVVSLEKAGRDGRLKPGGSEVRAWAMLGIAHFLGLNYCLWDGRMPDEQVMHDVMDFIGNGMAPKPAPARSEVKSRNRR